MDVVHPWPVDHYGIARVAVDDARLVVEGRQIADSVTGDASLLARQQAPKLAVVGHDGR